MDGNNLEPECDTTLHGEVDRISKLPDDIIAVILDFLSLREAARTSILSSRWLYLWKHTPILNFDTDIYEFDSPIRREMRSMESKASLWNVERSKYVELVNSVLQSHKAPCLKLFRISFYVNRLAQSHVIKWLEFVFLRGVEALVLHFVCNEPKYMVVLEELLRESGLCRPQNLILLKPLKRLYLLHFEVSGEAVKLILRSCPSLEELSIGSAVFTSDVEICGSNLVLKRLEVYLHKGNRFLKVSAPNLNWLKVDSSSENLLLENLPNLVGAEFRFRRRRSPNSLRNLTSALFCFSSQLEVLNLSLFCPEVLFANAFPQMPNLKKLVLEYWGVKTQSLLPVTALIWAAPRLEEFTLAFGKVHRAASIEVTIDAQRSPHQHLKVFEFAGFIGDALEHIELVTYVSENSIALRKLIVCCEPVDGCYGSKKDAEYMDEMQSSRNSAKEQLLGKLPQHIHLQIR